MFPKFSSSFLYRKCSTRYLEALRGEALGCRTPSRTPNLRKQRANVRHHGVIPWVLLGCSWAAPVLLGHSLGTPWALWLLLAALCLLLAAPAKLLGPVSEAKKMIKFSPKGTGEKNHRNERRNGSPEPIEDTESSARTCFTELWASEHCAVPGSRAMFPNVLQK